MTFRWWKCLQILRIYCQKITSPTSLRVRSVSNEHSGKDFCAELMHSLVLWWCWTEFYFCSKWNNQPIKWWLNRLSLCLVICFQVLHNSERAVTLHGFCPPAILQNQYWRSSFVHSSCNSFCKSICCCSVRVDHSWFQVSFSQTSGRKDFRRFLFVSWADLVLYG